LITPADAGRSADAIDGDSASHPAITPMDADAPFIEQAIVRTPDIVHAPVKAL
jgi:hypothetical protein